SLGDLECLRDELAERLARARRALHDRGVQEERNRVLLERMLLEPGKHKFARVTNRDLGEEGCVAWQVRPRLGLIGMRTGWWRVALVATGLAVVTLAGLELSIREHFAGYRSHSTLLSGAGAVVVAVPLFFVGVPREAVLLIAAVVFGLVFYLLRNAFARRTGGL